MTSGQNIVEDIISTLNALSFPVQLESSVNITKVDITTVCYPNGNGFQCKCEDRFAWSYDSCVAYTPCDGITQGTCQCINAIPSDGQFCHLLLNNSATTTTTGPATVSEAETSTNAAQQSMSTNGKIKAITTSGPTTLSSSVAVPYSTTMISTMEQITSTDAATVATTTAKQGTSANDAAATLTTDLSAITGLTTQWPVTRTVTMSTMSSPSLPHITARFNLQMSFSILQNFTEDLKDPATTTYQNLKQNVELSLHKNYKIIKGFIEVEVTDFRLGSVITEFLLQTNHLNSTEIAKSNNGIVTDLMGSGYNVDSNSFQAFLLGQDPFIKNYEIIYPGTTLELTCMVPEALQMGTASWFVKSLPVSNSAKHNITNSPPKLTVRDMSVDDSGTYGCRVNNSILIYLHEEVVNVTNIAAPIIKLRRSQVNSPCESTVEVSLECCVTYGNINDIEAKWVAGSELSTTVHKENNTKCFVYSFNTEQRICNQTVFTCQINNRGNLISEMKATVNFFSGVPDCAKDPYGYGKEGDLATVSCRENFEGSITAKCIHGVWIVEADKCILSAIVTLQNASQNLNEMTLPGFLEELKNTSESLQNEIDSSTATISAIVDILRRVSAITQSINHDVITNVLKTVTILVSSQADKSWAELNRNDETQRTSSSLLESVENITQRISSDSFQISTKNIELSKTTLTTNFSATLNSSQIFIPSQGLPPNTSITTVVFTTLNFVLPIRTTLNSTNNSNNGIVMLVYANRTINKVSLMFDRINKTQGINHCVFWNFKLFEGIGGWDSTGCTLQSENDDRVTCSCNHLTSFSILMSPSEDPEPALEYITYIGVSISMACLVLCLIIEAFVWKVVTKNSTSYMRHVSIVNIAVSLLFADIWFIVGAAVSGVGQTTPMNPCSAATFFIHFFYLALFFWMLISALLLFYRTIMVFSHMPKSTMMAIAFTVGYGAPLIIAIITIAVTLPQNGYFRQNDACWLNWDQTKALLAFVIPALIIVVVNLLILIVVLFKLLMRGVGENLLSEEKNALMVIIRCVAVLTPIFGITWGLGIGTMVAPENLGVHITFALFNSLQGFFILVFGILFDSRIRSAIVGRFSFLPMLSTQTRSTSAGPSLSSWVDRLRRRRGNFYNISDATASQGSSEAFINS